MVVLRECFFFKRHFGRLLTKTVHISHAVLVRRCAVCEMSVARGRCACPVEPVLVPGSVATVVTDWCVSGIAVDNVCFDFRPRTDTNPIVTTIVHHHRFIPFNTIFPPLFHSFAGNIRTTHKAECRLLSPSYLRYFPADSGNCQPIPQPQQDSETLWILWVG